MIQSNKNTLSEFADVLQQLGNSVYTKPCNLLTGATIGQHTRHIIELFQCLLSGYEDGFICYDKRQRNKLIENEVNSAVSQIEEIRNNLDRENKTLKVEYELGGNVVCLDSNYYREVMYNLEHTIHHLALIRVAISLMSDVIVSDSFGVAPSTLKYRSQCIH